MSSVLAFDTSTETLSVGLVADGRVWVRVGAGGAQAGHALIPTVQDLLREAGLTLAQLDAIGFGRGPGAFTGLRTACAVAQGLGFGSGKPVLPLDTLAVVARDAASRVSDPRGSPSGAVSETPETIWVAMDARMGEVYGARYQRNAKSGHWSATVPPALWTLEAFNVALAAQPAAVVAGSALAAFGSELGAAETGARLVPEAWPGAEALMDEASHAWSVGAFVDAARAAPVYLRDKVALTTAEREALKLARALSSKEASA